MLARGLMRACPRCGSGRLFRWWFQMAGRCPGCGLRFERRPEEAFFLGAFVIALGVTEGAVLLVLFAFILVEASSGGRSSVAPALGVAAAAAVILPLAFYPFSKTIWCAIDLAMHPLEADEERDAAAARAVGPVSGG
jgi:uncharacterized protein (DUF983 family)